jgi:hypothetical protein
MRKKLHPDLPAIEVIPDEEAETVDFLVCAPVPPSGKLLLADNFVGTCCSCGTQVQYRWHAPRRPKKICMSCAIKQLDQMAVDDPKNNAG